MSSAATAIDIAAINATIEDERSAALPDARRVADYRRYVLGTQLFTLSDEMKADLGNLLRMDNSHAYTDNLCRLAVTTAADYLQLARVVIDSENEAERALLEAFIAGLWTRNMIPELQNMANVAAYRDGNYAIGLDWDRRTASVRLVPMRWWSGTSGVFVHYDDSNLADWAVNEWAEGDTRHRVVYRSGQIERYHSRAGADWGPRSDADDTAWPQPWVDDAGQPLGIPVVHFPLFLIPNDAPGTGSNEADSRYGLSLLSGGALGVQDALNDAHYDLIVAARRSAFPLYTSTGVTLRPKVGGQPGETEPLNTAPGKMLNSPAADSRFGILNPGDLSQLHTVISGHTRVFARLTNTPMQIVNEEGTDAQSGVALYRMQLGAVRQAARTQTVFASRWGSVVHKAVILQRAFGGGDWRDLNPDVPLIGLYKSIEAGDLATMAEIAMQMTQAGFPLEFVLEEFGQTTENVQRIMDMKRNQAQSAMVALDSAMNLS